MKCNMTALCGLCSAFWIFFFFQSIWHLCIFGSFLFSYQMPHDAFDSIANRQKPSIKTDFIFKAMWMWSLFIAEKTRRWTEMFVNAEWVILWPSISKWPPSEVWRPAAPRACEGRWAEWCKQQSQVSFSIRYIINNGHLIFSPNVAQWVWTAYGILCQGFANTYNSET